MSKKKSDLVDGTNGKKPVEIKKTAHQKFEMQTMRRSDIKEAPYNPRMITEQNRKKLRSKMKAVGLLQPLVVNCRTGNLVSGHQRLATLDSLERGKDFELDVSVIDVDEKTEKEMVVFFNNPSAQGEFDLDQLAELNLECGIDFEDMGFEQYDIEMMFDGDSRFAQIFPDEPEIAQTGEKLEKVKAVRKEALGAMQKKNEAQFYFVVVCKDDEQRKELMNTIGVPIFEQFVEGAYLLENLTRGPLGRVKKAAGGDEPPA